MKLDMGEQGWARCIRGDGPQRPKQLAVSERAGLLPVCRDLSSASTCKPLLFQRGVGLNLGVLGPWVGNLGTVTWETWESWDPPNGDF